MTTDIKKILVYFNLALFSAAVWYIMAEVCLSFVWRTIWHQ
jgi:hypothetical protein